MGEEKISLTRSNLLTIALAVAVIAVVIAGIVIVTSPPTQPSQSTGLVTAQTQGSGSSAGSTSKGLAALPNMVGGC